MLFNYNINIIPFFYVYQNNCFVTEPWIISFLVCIDSIYCFITKFYVCYYYPQKWQNAIEEHVEFSSHYLKQGFSDSDPDDDEEENIMPVGTMQDKFQVDINLMFY